MLRQSSSRLTIRASRPGLTEFTEKVRSFVADSGIEQGLLTLFCRHTSASLVIHEAYFQRIAPEGDAYEHDDEGPDDMPAHLRTALTATQLSIPIENGRLALGTWQGIFLFEHRHSTPEREISLHLVGE
jgi:secondary thiamine-phosphate synthase enzyme